MHLKEPKKVLYSFTIFYIFIKATVKNALIYAYYIVYTLAQ